MLDYEVEGVCKREVKGRAQEDRRKAVRNWCCSHWRRGRVLLPTIARIRIVQPRSMSESVDASQVSRPREKGRKKGVL